MPDPRAAEELHLNAGGAALPEAQQIAEFQRHILEWYALFGRELPWRGDPDPYHILVSEIMLQQTQISRVLGKYQEFLARFPELGSLASATPAEVLQAWQGLGYNRRALSLKRIAEAAVRDHRGRLPATVHELQSLPGIGRYTARAVACFAFDVQVPVVDTNVRRVLQRFAGGGRTEREIWVLAERLVPLGRAAEWNQALMDYGAVMRQETRRKMSTGGTLPFAATNRFWRGRIVEVLRGHRELAIPDLLEELPYPNRDEHRVRGLIQALQEEGMVSYNAGEDSVGLPRQ
ncbi:MAG: A/G-specific adenine glycosylase [Chloroflexota bacterium]